MLLFTVHFSGKGSKIIITDEVDSASAYSGTLGDFNVSIDGAIATIDYEEEPAILIEFTFINNSAETTNFINEVTVKAFQDGIELDSAYIDISNPISNNNISKDIRPGAKIQVQQSFKLPNTSSLVEVEAEVYPAENKLLRKFQPSEYLSSPESNNTSSTDSSESLGENVKPYTSVDIPKDVKKYYTGVYKVGTDIVADEYLLTPTGTGYYQVANDSTGELSSITSNDNFKGQRYLTVSDGQYLKLERATMVTAIDVAPAVPNNGTLPEGMYKCGFDIAPREYKIKANNTSMAYPEVAKDSTGRFESIVANENFEGETYITISEGQYLKVDRATIIIE